MNKEITKDQEKRLINLLECIGTEILKQKNRLTDEQLTFILDETRNTTSIPIGQLREFAALQYKVWTNPISKRTIPSAIKQLMKSGVSEGEARRLILRMTGVNDGLSSPQNPNKNILVSDLTGDWSDPAVLKKDNKMEFTPVLGVQDDLRDSWVDQGEENRMSVEPSNFVDQQDTQEAHNERQPKEVAEKRRKEWVRKFGPVFIGLLMVVLVVFVRGGGGGPTRSPTATAFILYSTPMVKPSLTYILTYTNIPTTVRIATTAATITVVPKLAPILEVGSTMISEKDGMQMVYVPMGEFNMGSNDGDPDEQPVHEVYLDGYWIDKYEVSNAQYEACVVAGKCGLPVDTEHYQNANYGNHPVVFVTWYDATNYCKWVGRRLPTEAEWEMAARGVEGFSYPWGNESPNPSLVNFNSNIGDTKAIGSYPSGASPYGVMDMAGNVWEWVADRFDESYYGESPDRNPTGPESGDQSLRGGSWLDGDFYMRSTNRYGEIPVDGYSNRVGFRCVVDQN